MPGSSTSPREIDTEPRGETTLAPSCSGASARRPGVTTRLPALTVLCHPNRGRIGDRALLAAPRDGLVELSRTTPAFSGVSPAASRASPLDDRHLSRQPIHLVLGAPDGSITIRREGCPTAVEIDGEALDHHRVLDTAAMERGVPIVLGRHVALLLHLDTASTLDPPGDDLIGASSAMRRLRQEIRIAARLGVPVLLRGESGTGKELVARAIHDASLRAERSFLAVNLAAVQPTLAASELFGAAKGAFTGAATAKDGFFQRAEGGTLFLDEIGETPDAVQPLLLRALETGEVQGVGHAQPRRVDVRLIAATDADLEAKIASGAFRAPLLHRLAGYVIQLPPLRERRADFGRLLYAFLRRELESLDAGHLLDELDSHGRLWPSADLVARLAVHDWPGNVRQLKNVVRQLAIARATGTELRLDPELLSAGEPTSAKSSRVEPVPDSPRHGWRPAYRKPSEVGEDELLDTLRGHRFEPKATAEALGVSRASLYALIDAHPRIRKASELDATEIRAALNANHDDLAATAAALEVSVHALRQRLAALDQE